MSQGRSTRFFGDGKPPTFNRESGNPYNGYINPYYWVDDHPLLYGNNGSLDPSTDEISVFVFFGLMAEDLPSDFLGGIILASKAGTQRRCPWFLGFLSSKSRKGVINQWLFLVPLKRNK